MVIDHHFAGFTQNERDLLIDALKLNFQRQISFDPWSSDPGAALTSLMLIGVTDKEIVSMLRAAPTRHVASFVERCIQDHRGSLIFLNSRGDEKVDPQSLRTIFAYCISDEVMQRLHDDLPNLSQDKDREANLFIQERLTFLRKKLRAD